MSNKVTKSKLRPEPETPAPAADSTAVDLGMLPELLGYHVRLAQIAIFADFNRCLEHLELSPGLFALLVIIEANPGLKQTRLAEAAHLDRSTLVPALNKLEARGLVERRTAPGDRRSNGLFLTQAGGSLVRRASVAVKRHESGIASSLDEGERALLLEMLDRLVPQER